jgi:hypothetical protein
MPVSVILFDYTNGYTFFDELLLFFQLRSLYDTVMVLYKVLLPALLDATRVTLNEPVLLNTCVAFDADEVALLSANVHFTVVGIFVLVLVNVIVAPFFTVVGE